MAVSLLHSGKTGLVVVDAQTQLLDVMRRTQTTVANIIRLLRLAGQFHLPVIATQQHPKMMGAIASDIAKHLPPQEPIQKMDFSCCAVGEFNEQLEAAGIQSIMLAGLETHICILQTCLGLLQAGYEVHVPQDAVDSRTKENWRVGIELMREAGAVITSTETAIFQVLGSASAPQFKEMLRAIR